MQISIFFLHRIQNYIAGAPSIQFGSILSYLWKLCGEMGTILLCEPANKDYEYRAGGSGKIMLVQCELCPKACLMEPGQSGECRVRINLDGTLRSVVYGYPCARHIDPVEKKPLYHFLPGTKIVSIATVGCNLHCRNCQNWDISQANPEDKPAYHLPPEALVQTTKMTKIPSIAYTYTDPIIYYEYTLDSARLAKKENIRNVLVTAGYINAPPWKKLLEFIDAANIDLKSMSDEFYRDICSGTLKPVLDALVIAKSMNVWVEVTNLIIPTLNDSDAELQSLAAWVKQNLGAETPLHFSRFSPQHELRNLPPTPGSTLERARNLALAEGLKHVYIGNLMTDQGMNTYCENCRTLLIARRGYIILQNRMNKGRCPECNHQTAGVWQ
jgi:pyruvate formate lyase activating enzyme